MNRRKRMCMGQALAAVANRVVVQWDPSVVNIGMAPVALMTIGGGLQDVEPSLAPCIMPKIHSWGSGFA